jgi:hypothetical protein
LITIIINAGINPLMMPFQQNGTNSKRKKQHEVLSQTYPQLFTSYESPP